MFQTSGIFLSFYQICAYWPVSPYVARLWQCSIRWDSNPPHHAQKVCALPICHNRCPLFWWFKAKEKKSLWADLTWRLLCQKICRIETHERICFYREQVIKIMSPIQSGFSECHDYLSPLFCALKNYSLSYKECGEPCHIILYMEALMCNIGDLFLSLSLSLSYGNRLTTVTTFYFWRKFLQC